VAVAACTPAAGVVGAVGVPDVPVHVVVAVGALVVVMQPDPPVVMGRAVGVVAGHVPPPVGQVVVQALAARLV
jgi:hypothetical protein